jgi:2-polyprenyl-3-methyl-5-hydroxy-6-metoxy-1,4-benzoquinol methylase
MNSYLPYQDKPSRWSSHSIIAMRLDSLPDGSRILDVGTASGTLARMCQNKSLHLFGVEPNQEWAQAASPLYEKVWVGVIEDIADESLEGYDAVVLGDILEHVTVPDDVLRKLVTLQESGSIFMVSVPNVANIWVRLNLLVGRFDYTDRGILDRTHMRFFTRKLLVAMVENAGLKIDSIRVTPIPLELVSNFFISPLGRFIHGVFAQLTTLFPTLLGYQFIVEARIP